MLSGRAEEADILSVKLTLCKGNFMLHNVHVK